MVVLHIKRGEESLFLFEGDLNQSIQEQSFEICSIHNGRLKIGRVCSEIRELIKHGISLPPEFLGLTDEQIEELKLVDCWKDKCIPSGGFIENKDPIGCRNGRQPKEQFQEILTKAIEDAKQMIDKKLVLLNQQMTLKIVEEALDILRGAITIVYPMKLPPHDPISMEFANIEDLSGTQASKEVIEPSRAQLWFAGRQMLPDKLLKDYVGVNDKTKVIIKLTKTGEGPPGREPVLTEDVRKRMMADAYRRQEQLKKLQEDDDDSYLNSGWSNNNSLKLQVHGLENVKFRVGK